MGKLIWGIVEFREQRLPRYAEHQPESRTFATIDRHLAERLVGRE
jgi:hypothetical protein